MTMARPLLLPLLWLAVVSAAVPEFLSDAADKVTTPQLASNTCASPDFQVKADFKRRGSRTDFQTIVVEWHPAELVVDKSDVDVSKQIVEVQEEGGEWRRAEQVVFRSGRYRGTFTVVPCKSHSLRFTVVGKDGQEATFEFPGTVGPASEEDIAASRFTPDAPTNIRATALSGNRVEVSWEAAACATTYEVYGSSGRAEVLSSTTDQTSVVLEGAESCATYDISVTALTGQEASEEATVELSTSPGESAGEKLEVNVAVGVNSIEANWDGWRDLSCVESYTVEVCRDGQCGEEEVVSRNEFGGNSSFTSAELEECSDYSLQVKPLFEGQDLDAKVVSFRTLAPGVTGVEEKLGTVTAEAGEGQMVSIKWSPVKCAASYEVYQKQHIEGSEWEVMRSVEEAEVRTQGVPCTEYSYGVRATIDGQQSGLVEATALVTIPLDSSVPYHAPGLQVQPSLQGLQVSWEHARCITQYRLQVCGLASGQCLDHPVEVAHPDQHLMEPLIDNLEPCTDYAIKIVATNNGAELEAESQQFRTLSPAPSPPSDLSVSLNPASGQLDVSFSAVQCASVYKVHQSLDSSQLEVVVDTVTTAAHLPAPPPCSTYAIGVSSVTDGQESGLSQLTEGRVLADTSHQAAISLDIVNTENMTVQFVVKMPQLNHKCQVTGWGWVVACHVCSYRWRNMKSSTSVWM